MSNIVLLATKNSSFGFLVTKLSRKAAGGALGRLGDTQKEGFLFGSQGKDAYALEKRIGRSDGIQSHGTGK